MLIIFNKPFGVLSQFTDKASGDCPRATLSDYIDMPGVYPAGRLDRDSEGLMLLTDDGRLQARIANPKFKAEKTYWAQVEGLPDDNALETLRCGVTLKDGRTRPADVARMDPPEGLWPRTPPIRLRKSVPDSWITMTLREGKNRQLRRMTAHVGHPTLRLIRVQIGRWSLGDLEPGAWQEVETPTTQPDRGLRRRR